MCPREKGGKDEGGVTKDTDKENAVKLRILFLTKKENRFSNNFPHVLTNKKK